MKRLAPNATEAEAKAFYNNRVATEGLSQADADKAVIAHQKKKKELSEKAKEKPKGLIETAKEYFSGS